MANNTLGDIMFVHIFMFALWFWYKQLFSIQNYDVDDDDEIC